MISIENVEHLVRQAYIWHAKDAFGEEGARAIRELLNAVKLIYQRCPPESLQGVLTVVIGMDSTPSSPTVEAWGAPIRLHDYAALGRALTHSEAGATCLIEIVPDGTFYFLEVENDIDPKAAASNALVYRYFDGEERILARDHDDYLRKISPLLKSNFANPTLSSLEEALSRYRQFAAETRCHILSDIWEGGVDGPRLVLVNRPESRMRDSLTHALELLLRDANARPEHNTDESKPVDIRVEWFASSSAALIEIKWLGRSTANPRRSSANTSYTDYGARRAQEGAEQLADYLDREARHTGSIVTRGYLVIFDARRKNIAGHADQLNADDALYFASDDLEFNPDYAQERDDFATPVRFFLRPRQSHFATS